MEFMTLLLVGAITAVGLPVLGEIARQADEYRLRHATPPEDSEQDTQETSRLAIETSTALVPVVEVGKPAEQRTPEERASYWWRRLGSQESGMGLAALLVEPPVLLLNAYIISISMEILFGDPGPPLFILNLWGWGDLAVTMHVVSGFLLSVGQLLMGSFSQLPAARQGLLRVLVWIGLPTFVGIEVALAYARGVMVEGQMNAVLSAGFALGMGLFEVTAGILAIDFLILRFGLGLYFSVTAPLWWIWEWWERKRAAPRFSVPQVRRGHPMLMILAWPFALLHRGPFALLRSVDEKVAQLFTRNRDKMKGEASDEDSRITTAVEHESRTSSNGHVPERVAVVAGSQSPVPKDRVDRGPRQNVSA